MRFFFFWYKMVCFLFLIKKIILKRKFLNYNGLFLLVDRIEFLIIFKEYK